MRLYKNGKDFPIITSNDVIMSNTSIGSTLTDVFESQDNELKSLKSNVKWLYKYGGVGGKYSNDKENTGSFSIYATLGGSDKQIVNGGKLLLSAGRNQLSIQISRPAGRTFTARYTIEGGSESSPISLNQDNEWKTTIQVRLLSNSTITIKVVDSDGEIKTLSCSYVVTPYVLNTYFEQNNSSKLVSIDELNINTLIAGGFNFVIEYNIAINASIGYKIYSTNPILQNAFDKIDSSLIQNEISDKGGKVKIPLNDTEFLNPDNAGTYTINVDFSISDNDNNTLQTTYTEKIKFTMIPNSLFLILTSSYPNSVIYNDNNYIEEPYQFSSGFVTLNMIAYDGSDIVNSATIESARFNNEPIHLPANTIKFRGTGLPLTIWTEASDDPQKIDITISRNGRTYTRTSYIYVKEQVLGTSWYGVNRSDGEPTQITPSSDSIHYTFGQIQIDESNYGLRYQLDKYSGMNEIEFKSNSNDVTTFFEMDPAYAHSSIDDIMINIGIQFNSINASNIPIMSFEDNTDNENDIILFQNALGLGSSREYVNETIIPTSSVSIFVPKETSYNKLTKENYHLITICRRYVPVTENTGTYELVCYIDGKIENAFSKQVGQSTGIKTVKFYKGNYSINLIDISYFGHAKSSINYDERTWPEDADVSNFYHVYKSTMGQYENDELNEKALNILNVTSSFYEDSNGFIRIPDRSAIITISKNCDVPILLIKYNEYENKIKRNIENFKVWFSSSYSEEDVIYKPIVSLCYMKNNDDTLRNVDIPDDSYFDMSIQGSSTRRFFVKNLNLTIHSNVADYEYLYSPNFLDIYEESVANAYLNNEKEVYNTFLPEKTFTLKADISDSSHCNNVTVGRFVNDYTTKFTDAIKDTIDHNSKYLNYVKNCLLGFPIIVCYEITKNDDDNTTEYYYGGIYNFNLGRDSYFNLGYMDPAKLDTLSENSVVEKIKNGTNDPFVIYKIYTDSYKFKDELCVAEIQGNSNYFDFSQYDKTILFPIDNTDNLYMFGDIVPENHTTETQNSIQKFVENVAKTGGRIFSKIQKNFGTDATDGYGDGYNASLPTDRFTSIGQVPNYRQQYKKQNSDVTENGIEFVKFKYLSDNETYEANDDRFAHSFLFGEFDDETNTMVKEPGLDITSLIEYYVICMAFGLVDSVQKNLNVKTWSRRDEKGNKYYIAFYDMDTSFGRSNSGATTTYFAFSDYWNSNAQKDATGTYKTTKIEVYRDFYPSRSGLDDASLVPTGYDVPSSYLFAIAKYAHLIYESSLQVWPSVKWAEWRQVGGPLENVKKFMKNYFTKDILKVPDVLMNLNYRFKYLKKASMTVNDDDNSSDTTNSMFSNYNLTPLHGTGIYEVEEWLNGRLHILDAYFNLGDYKLNIQKYDKNTSTWVNTGITERLISSVFAPNLANNPDIIVLRDMLNNNNGSKWDGGTLLAPIIKTPYLSPLIIASSQQTNRYLFTQKDAKYKIEYIAQGNEFVKFNGSILWTFVDDLSQFIIDNSITINSDNLEIINMKKYFPCGTFSFDNIKSVKEITLNNAGYSGNIEFIENTTGTLKYPNLTTIDLSNSSIKMKTVSNCGVQNIILTNTDAQGTDIQINDCNNLKNVKVGGLKCSSLTINPCWGEDITISNSHIKKMILYASEGTNNIIHIENDDTVESIVLKGFQEIYILNCPLLSNLYIQNNIIDPDDPNSFIENDVKVLSVVGCNTKVRFNSENIGYIQNFNIGTKSEVFDIDNNNLVRIFEPEGFGRDINGIQYVTFDEPENATIQQITGIVDLSKFKKLKKICFGGNGNNLGSKGFNYLILPDIEHSQSNNGLYEYDMTIELLEGAFAYTQLAYIDSLEQYREQKPENEKVKYLFKIMGPQIFKCSLFRYRSTDNTIIFNNLKYAMRLTIDRNVNSLAECFGVENAAQFPSYISGTIYSSILSSIRNSVQSNSVYNNVTDISRLFYNQSISYSLGAYREDAISTTSNYFNLGKLFPNANNISQVFEGNPEIEIICREMFKDFKSQTLTIYNFITSAQYICIDTFLDIIDKVKGALMFNTAIKCTFKVVDHDGYEMNAQLSKLFNPIDEDGVQHFPKMVDTLTGMSFSSSNYTVDYSDIFNTNWISLTGILNCFCNGELSNRITGLNRINLSDLDYVNVENPLTIKKSFCLGNVNNPVDMRNLLPWQRYMMDLGEVFEYSSSSTDGSGSYTNDNFLLYKKIKTTQIPELFDKILDYSTKTKLTINNVLYNTFVINDDNDELILSTNQLASRIISMPYMMANALSIKQTVDLANGKRLIDVEDWNESYYKEIPFTLTHSTFANISNIESLDYAFFNITLSGNLPYDFFNKARVNNGTITYRQDIKSLIGTFKNVKIDNDIKYFTSMFVDVFGDEIEKPEEFDDFFLNDPKAYIESMKHVFVNPAEHTFSDGYDEYRNWPITTVDDAARKQEIISGTIKHMILPPDILFGCVSNCSLAECFADSEFMGLLPNKLFKNCMNATINDIFRNLLVIPRHVKTYTGKDGKTYRIFAFVPDNFILQTQLVNSFSFKLLVALNNVLNVQTMNDITKYYVLSPNSMPETVSSIATILPTNGYLIIKPVEGGIKYQPNTSIEDLGFRISIIYDIQEITDEEYNTPGMEEYKFEEDDKKYCLYEGLDITNKYKDIQFRGELFVPVQSAIFTGYIFKHGTDIRDYNYYNILQNIISIGESTYIGQNRKLILPAAYMEERSNKFITISRISKLVKLYIDQIDLGIYVGYEGRNNDIIDSQTDYTLWDHTTYTDYE